MTAIVKPVRRPPARILDPVSSSMRGSFGVLHPWVCTGRNLLGQMTANRQSAVHRVHNLPQWGAPSPDRTGLDTPRGGVCELCLMECGIPFLLQFAHARFRCFDL